MKKKHLLKAMVFAAITFTVLPMSVEARGKLTFDQAVQKCTDRAVEFGRQPYGRLADSPPENKVQDQYRSCVFANSGQYPTSKVKYRESILTLLKDAF
jgi:hypothetical protein